MALRRNRATPFEVMAHRTGRKPTGPAEVPSAPAAASAKPARQASESYGGGDGGEGRPWAAASGWWARLGAGMPVVLRVPRGLAVVLVLALVGLLMLSYWVGHSRGSAEMIAEAGQMEASSSEAPMRPAPGEREGVASGLEGDAGGGEERGAVDGGRPVRQAGLNYFVLAAYPPDAAERLSEWLLEEHGVATVLQPVQNRGLREVIAVDRGFARHELSSDERRAYERRLREIGRAWERLSRDNLSSMYPRRYDGP